MPHKPETETWVNLYEDSEGRFLGDSNHGDKDSATEERDEFGPYVKTIRITDKSIQEESNLVLQECIDKINNYTDDDAHGSYDESVERSISILNKKMEENK
jgi:hypothetical protein